MVCFGYNLNVGVDLVFFLWEGGRGIRWLVNFFLKELKFKEMKNKICEY